MFIGYYENKFDKKIRMKASKKKNEGEDNEK